MFSGVMYLQSVIFVVIGKEFGTFGLTNGSHVPVLCLQQVNASLTGVTRTRGNLNVATRAAGGISPSPNSRWAMRTGWQA